MKSKSYRRLFRFSLRTLLILLTLYSIWLGHMMHRLYARRDAWRAIHECGGSCGFAIVGPAWLRYLVRSKECFYDAVRISFDSNSHSRRSKSPFGDDDFAEMVDQINVYAGFNTLDLGGSGITDHTLNHLTKLKKFRKIVQLVVSNTQVSDQGIADISTLKALTFLDIGHTNITQDGIVRLQRALPNCEIQH
ncbi:MAG TPA: hypothetical protein VHE81_21000 [Lacipirellulaceae bacterium]|nr:hypothetical protein [Lacipirellulaceae bacterium]